MLIGITGKAGSGKDTFADLLTECNEGQRFTRYAFAEPIKKMVEVGFGLPPEVWDDRYLKEAPIEDIGKSPRFIAQTLGTEWARETIHPDIWLLLAERRLQEAGNLIITDVRFDNEAEWLQKRGGILVEVIRDSNTPAVDNAGHSSERGISDRIGRITVQNDGTIETLREKARVLLALTNA